METITKNITIEVSKECWKKLKLIGIQKETTIVKVLSNILEKSVSKQKMDVIEI